MRKEERTSWKVAEMGAYTILIGLALVFGSLLVKVVLNILYGSAVPINITSLLNNIFVAGLVLLVVWIILMIGVAILKKSGR